VEEGTGKNGCSFFCRLFAFCVRPDVVGDGASSSR